MRRLLFIPFLFSTLIFLGLPHWGCPENGIMPKQNPLQLTVEDVSSTEAWLKISVAEGSGSSAVTLKRSPASGLAGNDSTIISDLRLPATAGGLTSDTLVVDEGLLPKQTYTYTLLQNNWNVTAQATTMDTTSHAWTFQQFLFGDASSVLYDVAIVKNDPDSQLIFAVGEIYLKDSTGQIDPNAYNLVKWDGKRWELKRIPSIICGNGSQITSPLRAIFALNPNDIWFSDGGEMIHWNGSSYTNDCSMNALLTGAINKIFAVSPEDIYAVGNAGTIVHYTNGIWQKIESGTTVDLKDVYGTPDGKEVWTCGENTNDGKSVLLRIYNNESKLLWSNYQAILPSLSYQYGLSTLWTSGKIEFLVTGSSGWVYHHSLFNYARLRRDNNVDLSDFPYRIRGSGLNSAVVIGDNAMIYSWNGLTWQRYDEVYNSDDRLYGLAVSSSLVISVGRSYRTFPTQALTILGRR